MKKLRWTLTTLLFLLLFVSCTAEPTEPANDQTPTTEMAATEPLATAAATAVLPTPTEDGRTVRLTPVTTPELEIVAPTNPPAIVGEVPEAILNDIYADLTTLTGAEKETITLITAQELIWSDGALGCPQPGEVYTQATVPGYQVILELNSTTYDYHIAEDGYFILCENSLSAPPVSGTPDA